MTASCWLLYSQLLRRIVRLSLIFFQTGWQHEDKSRLKLFYLFFSFWTLPSFSYNSWLYSLGDKKIEHIKDGAIRAFIEESKRCGLCSTGYTRLAFASRLKKHAKILRKKVKLLIFSSLFKTYTSK